MFQFQARDVNLVMGPAARGSSVPFRELLDRAAPGGAHGLGFDAQGNGTLADQRLHQPGLAEERLFEIDFLGAGALAYCFTFRLRQLVIGWLWRIRRDRGKRSTCWINGACYAPAGFAVAAWRSQPSMWISPRIAPSPGTSVRSLRTAPK